MSSPSHRPPEPPAGDGRRPGAERLQATLGSGAIGAIAGAISGLLWGGVGGRIAMRVVFLTSNDSVRGLTSDDGFEIGQITTATIFLLIFTSVLGAVLGALYGLLRMFTAGPTWAVAMGVTLATAAGGGASIVHADGVDFRFLDPLWLTIGLFIVLPAGWALTVVLLTERLLRPGALGDSVSPFVHDRIWGVPGWILLGVITVAGVRDLVTDIAALT